MWPWWVKIHIEDFADATLTTLMTMMTMVTMTMMKVTQWWKLSSDGSYPVMKVTQQWKLPSNEGYAVMSSDESWNCQRSEKEWWLVTFRLWQCFPVFANFVFAMITFRCAPALTLCWSTCHRLTLLTAAPPGSSYRANMIRCKYWGKHE